MGTVLSADGPRVRRLRWTQIPLAAALTERRADSTELIVNARRERRGGRCAEPRGWANGSKRSRRAGERPERHLRCERCSKTEPHTADNVKVQVTGPICIDVERRQSIAVLPF